MGWFDIARNPDTPWPARVAAGVACGSMPWACIGQEAGESAAEHQADIRRAARDLTVLGEAGGESGIMDELRTTITTAGDAAAAPMTAASQALMWGSILAGVVLLAAVLGLLVWYVLIPFFKGGPAGGGLRA